MISSSKLAPVHEIICTLSCLIISEKIVPISNEIKKLTNDKDFLDKILFEGVKKAKNIADKKVKKMHEIVGF